MNLTKKAGFTLIELLVVITIIGILATGGVAVYTGQIQKARDTVRIQDVSALKSAVEQFYGDKSEYPVADATITGFSGVSIYMSKIPQDPKSWTLTAAWQAANGSALDYVYNVAADPSSNVIRQIYEISTALENAGNAGSKAVNSADKWNDGNRLEVGAYMDVVGTTNAAVRGVGVKSCDAAAASNGIWIRGACGN